MTATGVEARRKAVHIGMAGFALLLPTLGWKGSAAAAGAALLFNLFALPLVARDSLSRPEDGAHRVPVGILVYPVTVLLLVLVFRHRLELAAAGWGYLAFGDGFATLAGKAWGRRRLPWNGGKSWVGLAAYVVFGASGALGLYSWVAGRSPAGAEAWGVLLAAVIGAGVESLPSELDDNLAAPVIASLSLAVLLDALPGVPALLSPELAREVVAAGAVNALLAGTALALKVVRPSGALAGGVLGTVILGLGGLPAYALLWCFFAPATVLTRLGRRRKEALGKAEPSSGRRGAANVLANVGVPAFLAVAAGLSSPMVGSSSPGAPNGPSGPDSAGLYRLALAAAFATALMDTVGTEVGQAVRSPTVLLPDFRPVPPGTDGAVSVAGTAAGLLAAAGLAAVAGRLWSWPAAWVGIVVVAALAGSVSESLLGREGAAWRVTNGHVLNFLNTIVGATAAVALAGLA